METIANSNGIELVMWREEQTTVGQPALRSGRLGKHKKPRETKDEMEEWFREFHKTLAPLHAKRGSVAVNGGGLCPTTDIQRLKLRCEVL